MLTAFALCTTLTLGVTLTSDVPPRSAALLQGDLNKVDRELAASVSLPAWAPLVAGVGVGGGLGVVGYLLLANMPRGLEGIFHLLGGFAALGVGALFAVAGIITAVVMGIVSAVRGGRVEALQQQRGLLREQLERARERETAVTAPPALTLQF